MKLLKLCLNESITISPALNWTIGMPVALGKKVSIVPTNSLRSSGFDKPLLGNISTRYKLLSEIYLLLKFSGISLDKLSGIEPRFKTPDMRSSNLSKKISSISRYEILSL